ncbi:MAG: shikimate kinase [Mariprofundaceae bacterium]|nr:shikimate kinase [Mariprofundaceae bacterium]
MQHSKEAKVRISPVLVGLMGSGKSSIGRRLAPCLKVPLVDLDDYIVAKDGRSIADIFKQDGEAFFRQLETRCLREVLGQHAVIATGGGVVLLEENRQLLIAHPPVIWLHASPKFLAKRIVGDSNRPLVAGKKSLAETLKCLQELADVRYPLYEGCADYVLPRGDMRKPEALNSILVFLEQWMLKHPNSSTVTTQVIP